MCKEAYGTNCPEKIRILTANYHGEGIQEKALQDHERNCPNCEREKLNKKLSSKE